MMREEDTRTPLAAAEIDAVDPMLQAEASPQFAALRRALASGPVALSLAVLAVVALAAILAPVLWTTDPIAISPATRLRPVSPEHWLGTDAFGRDVYSRVIYGAQVSLLIGLGVTLTSVFFGMIIGIIAGYFRVVDSLIMRIMDGIMAIPGILLAIALVTLSGASLTAVIVAITVPEIPRVVRLVRSVILGVRNEPYVEAAIALGTRAPALLMRHLVPNAIPPLIVQGTFIFASAMLAEAAMSFLGVGLPPEIPSWGNVMAEGRTYFQLLPGLILYPGILLAFTVLAINILGDALRDALDPRMARRL